MSRRFFGFHRDLPPQAAAHILGGRVTWEQRRGRQWIAIVSFDRVENAQAIWKAAQSGCGRLARGFDSCL
jgi:hypothetical protein